jgi:MFS family permease
LVLVALGLGLFSLAPVGGSFALHVLPGMLLLGLGCGIALNPVLLAALSDVAPTESGLASGIVNTAFSMGGALGLAVLASLAASRTEQLQSSGLAAPVALNGGYQLAFLVGAVAAGIAALLSVALIRPKGDSHGQTRSSLGADVEGSRESV